MNLPALLNVAFVDADASSDGVIPIVNIRFAAAFPAFAILFWFLICAHLSCMYWYSDGSLLNQYIALPSLSMEGTGFPTASTLASLVKAWYR